MYNSVSDNIYYVREMFMKVTDVCSISKTNAYIFHTKNRTHRI